MLNLFFWLIFGILAGWVEAQVSDWMAPRQLLLQVATGAIGALAGGRLALGTRSLNVFYGTSIIMAAIGGLVLATISGYLLDRNAD